jgi:hypothetical protein
VLPIDRSKQKELSLLSIKSNNAPPTVLYLAKINFANELVLSCEIDGNLNESEFRSIFAVAELSVKEYAELEEDCLRKFKEEKV